MEKASPLRELQQAGGQAPAGSVKVAGLSLAQCHVSAQICPLLPRTPLPALRPETSCPEGGADGALSVGPPCKVGEPHP